ncbi:MAG: ATP synthase subunit C [Nitrososphaerota archaeon]
MRSIARLALPILAILLFQALLIASVAAEQPALTSEAAQVEAVKFLSMMLSVSICGAAAAYAVARVSVAAMASAAERPEILGRAIIFAGLAEGIAIYGLLIAILIWITTV